MKMKKKIYQNMRELASRLMLLYFRSLRQKGILFPMQVPLI